MKFTKILAGILLVLAIGLAILAWMLGRETPREVNQHVGAPTNAAASNEASTKSTAAHFSVLAARNAIPAGHRLTEADIQVLEKTEAVVGSFTQPAELIGKTTLLALNPEQVVLEQYLVTGLSLQLENGQRAVSIAVKEPMAAGNHIRPGDFVDVFFTLQQDEKLTKVDTQTRLLLARTRVLAYGSGTVENPPATLAQRRAEQAKENSQRGSSREEARSRADVANTAVLAIPLEDVQRLTLAEKYGQLSLALRHPDDLEMPDIARFAELPAALRPVGQGVQKAGDLDPMDRAYAGLRLSDLADGGAKSKGVTAAVPRSASRAGSAHNAAVAQTVELLNGSSVQTVRY